MPKTTLEGELTPKTSQTSFGNTSVQQNFVSFVEKTRESLGEDKAAVIIMYNFKGQITPAMNELLEQHHIHSCLLSPNTTDHLQPMDLSVNKPAKAFLRGEFQK